jgi:CubicO group peptidase (beta-lactamase class C family)
MAGQRSAALLIVQDGKLRLERYGLGFDAAGRWTSFSVAKSFTSTLVGAALRDGHIKSMDDKVSDYIPQMKGSAYDDVSIRQLLTMTSGVRWNETTATRTPTWPSSTTTSPSPAWTRWSATCASCRARRRPARAGTTAPARPTWWASWSARPPEAAGQYLSREDLAARGHGAAGHLDPEQDGQEISGCCIQAATRDFARLGQFILNGATVNGQSIVPEGWLAEATTTRSADIGQPGRGYGYQWWTYDDGSFAARGIFGQGIFIDPQAQAGDRLQRQLGRRREPTRPAARRARLLQGGAEGGGRRGDTNRSRYSVKLSARTRAPHSPLVALIN